MGYVRVLRPSAAGGRFVDSPYVRATYTFIEGEDRAFLALRVSRWAQGVVFLGPLKWYRFASPHARSMVMREGCISRWPNDSHKGVEAYGTCRPPEPKQEFTYLVEKCCCQQVTALTDSVRCGQTTSLLLNGSSSDK